MAYPDDNTAIPSYAGTALQGDIDHAGWHAVTNTDLDGVKTVLGVNGGTAVLKNFTEGNFAARTDSETFGTPTLNAPTISGAGTMSGTIINGVINNTTIGTSAITGGTATSQNIVTPVINGAITGDAIATGATINTGTANDDIVTSKAIKDANILSQAWTAWTPVFPAGVTKGDGVTAGQYTRIGKTVIARFSFILGSTSAITGLVHLTLPVTSVSYTGTSGQSPIAQVCLLDTGTAQYVAIAVWSDTTTCVINVLNAAGTYLATGSISATVPFTWASTDEIAGYLIYEAA